MSQKYENKDSPRDPETQAAHLDKVGGHPTSKEGRSGVLVQDNRSTKSKRQVNSEQV